MALLPQCNSSGKATDTRTDDQNAETILWISEIFELFERHLMT